MNVWRKRGALFLAVIVMATSFGALFVSTPAAAAATCEWVNPNLVRCNGIALYKSARGYEGADNANYIYELTGVNAQHNSGTFTSVTKPGGGSEPAVVNRVDLYTNPVTKTDVTTRTTTPINGATNGGTCTAPSGTGSTGQSNCGTGGGASTGAATGADSAPACDTGSLTWILCPVIGLVGGAVEALKDAVLDQLQYRLLDTSGGSTASGASVKDSWKIFRDFTNALFVLIFIIMIFGTALGMDNYSTKKILPRLIAAAVLIQLSYLITAFGVTASNVTGFGMAQLFGSVNPDAINNDNLPMFKVIGNFLAVGGIAAGATTLALAPGLIIPFFLFLAGLLISLLTVFFTLQLRIILLTIFIVIAPLAILLWTLPNTERYFQTWRKYFVRLLLMYPMIGALFAGGNLVSNIALSAQKTANGILLPHLAAIPGLGGTVHLAAISDQFADTWPNIIASLIPIIVFFMVPATFKFAGGLMSLGSNMIGKVGKAGQNNLKNSGWRKRYDEGNKARSLRNLQNMPDSGGGFGTRAKRVLNRQQAGFGMLPPGENTKNAMRSAINKEAALRSENTAHEQFQEANGGKQSFDSMTERGAATKRDDLVKQEASRITAAQWRGADTKDDKMISLAKDEAINGTEPQKLAAIQFLSQTAGGREELRDVKNSLSKADGGTMKPETLKTWRNALEGTSVASKAPDLIKGNGAFSSTSPAEMAEWDKNTTATAVKHWDSLQAKVDAGTATDGERKTLAQANSAITGLMEAPALKAKFEPDAAAELHKSGAIAGSGTFLSSSARGTLSNNFATDGSRVTIDKKTEETKSRISTVLEQHAQYETSQGRATTKAQLEDRYFNGGDPNFKLQVDQAANSSTPISQIVNNMNSTNSSQSTSNNSSSQTSTNNSSSQFVGGSTSNAFNTNNRQTNASYTTNTVGGQQRVTFAPPAGGYAPGTPQIKVAASVVAPQGNVPQVSATPLVQPVQRPADPSRIVIPDINTVVQRSGSGQTYTKSATSDIIYPTSSREAPATVVKTASDGSTYKVTDRRKPAISARLRHSDADGNPEPGDDRSIQ